MNRQLERRLTRVIGTHAVGQVIPDAPRRLKRLCGRMYGNAAFRQMNGLIGNHHGYRQYVLHRDILDWIEKESRKIRDGQKESAEAGVSTEGTKSSGQGDGKTDWVAGDREVNGE